MYSSCERHKTVSVFPPENLKLPILYPSCKGVNTDHPPPQHGKILRGHLRQS